jgi:hypothetical protein
MLTGISNKPIVTSSYCYAVVTYTSTALLTFITYCYYKTCHKLFNRPYLVFAYFLVLLLLWSNVLSSLKMTLHSNIAKHVHCTQCRSLLYINYNHEINNKDIGICIKSIDFVQEKVLKQLLRTHIFVKEKAS